MNYVFAYQWPVIIKDTGISFLSITFWDSCFQMTISTDLLTVSLCPFFIQISWEIE